MDKIKKLLNKYSCAKAFKPCAFFLCAFLFSFFLFSTAYAANIIHIKTVEWIGLDKIAEANISKQTLDSIVQTKLRKSNNKVSQEELFAIVDAVTIHFRDNGYKFTTAYLPEQNLSKGKLKIAILEGKLGDIQFPNEKRDFVKNSIRFVFSDLIGKPVYEPDFAKRIDLLNSDPRTKVFGFFSRGSNTGEARVNFKVKRFDRWQLLASIDNFGTPATGKNRVNLKGAFFSPLNRLDTLMAGLIYTRGENSEESSESSTYGYLAYELPLWNLSNRLTFYAGNNLFDIGGDFDSLELEGNSKVRVLGFSHDFEMNNRLSTSLRIIDTDYQSSLNSPQIEPDEEELGLSINWQLSIPSETGLSVISTNIGYVGGNFNNDESDEDITFSKTEFKLDAYTLLAAKSRFANQWHFSLKGQYASKLLPNAERRSLTGISGIRAIEAGYFSGDNTAHCAIELRFPHLFGINNLFGLNNKWRLQPVIFVDGVYGEKISDDAISDRIHVSGAGIGFELNGYQQFYANIYAMDLIESYSKSNSIPDKMQALATIGISF